jgi:hypothetical protein
VHTNVGSPHIKDKPPHANHSNPRTMKSLRLAMIAVGIPKKWTSRLMHGLGISSVEELADLETDAVMRVPMQFRDALIVLRNSHVPDNTTLWYKTVDMV